MLLSAYTGSGLAQDVPNFSGVFLRERIEDRGVVKVSTETETLLILDIRQDAETLRVTRMQHGVEATEVYSLTGKPTINASPDGVRSRDRVSFDNGKLILDSEWKDPENSRAPATEEMWELSPDLQTLTVQPRIKASGALPKHSKRIAIFSRQPSLQIALERAEAASGAGKCRTNPRQMKKGKWNLSYGTVIGYTDYEELVWQVGFQANVHGDFFSGLWRRSTGSQIGFRKNGRPVRAYDGTLDLDVIPWRIPHPLYLFPSSLVIMGWGPGRLPESLLNLRFHIEWAGPESRDLGEVPTRLEDVPWSKDGSITRKIYRIRVPAQGVPITDSLEIHILSSAGKQLGCISGRL